jgi:5-methyltetrahydropteroyltriglutamate--homocysteine methyltransferase
LKRLENDDRSPRFARPRCIGEVKSRGQGELGKDIANLQAAMRAHGIERGFMNAASPGVISLFLQNEHYPTRDAYLAALADAMKAEYETIVAAGLDLQLDCPDLALSRHMLFTDLSDDDFVKVAASHVEALNHALSGRAGGPGSHSHLLGQLRGATCLRHPHGEDVRYADVGQGALRPVRDVQSPPRA